MSESLARKTLSLIFISLALPAAAQTPAPNRDASFINEAPTATSEPAFSGLATAPVLVAPPVVEPVPPPIPVTQAPDVIQKVDSAPLPDVSPESVGTREANGLGADMWKGTPRATAETLLSGIMLTTSPVLNDLVRRLLATAAAPPDGKTDVPQLLTSTRVEKLLAFADAAHAWSLATHADSKLVDDIAFHQAAETLLAGDGDSICATLPILAQNRAKVDWQKSLVICQMRAKDTQAAQVSLDVLRAQAVRDDIFLQVADKNVLGTSKTLPTQLTPLTPALLGALRLTGLALPGELYGHPDFALVPALLHAPAKQDVAQLGLAERAATRGVISGAQLGDIYKAIVFKPDELTNPLTATESGSRLRALLYQAAIGEKDPQQRLIYLAKFVALSPPELLNGIGTMIVDSAGTVAAEPTAATNALAVTQIYMLGNHNAEARDWLQLVKRDFTNPDFQTLWPQFVLAGLESDGDYAADLGQWSDALLAPTDANGGAKTDAKVAHDTVAAALLLFDAAGYIVPDALWAKILTPSQTEKHITLSPLYLERLRAASTANHRAETVLLATSLAGDGDISLPAAVEITRALRLAGFKTEAISFARQMLPLFTKQ